MKTRHKKWVRQWKTAAEKLEQQRAFELEQLTDERARRISEWVLSEFERLIDSSRKSSGLVDQQKYFMRWRG